jgi:hypothetical protein
MDGSRFDRLTKTLSAPGSRRRALGGLLAGTLGLLGWHDGDEITAHDLKAKCKKKSGAAKKKCLKKAKKHAAQHAREVPPPCFPELQATTCAAGCGPRRDNCNRPVTCPCPGGQTCLPNGTCARPCSGLPGQCAGCTPVDFCLVSTEGPSRCGGTTSLQPCDPANTTGCPRGFVCVPAGVEPRCFPVAVCPPI